MLDEQLIRCDQCKHYIQGFNDDEQALSMRKNWCGFCTANAPVGRTMSRAQLEHEGMQFYAFPVVKFNWRCGAFKYKRQD